MWPDAWRVRAYKRPASSRCRHSSTKLVIYCSFTRRCHVTRNNTAEIGIDYLMGHSPKYNTPGNFPGLALVEKNTYLCVL